MARLIGRNGAGRLAAEASDALEAILVAGDAAALSRAYTQALNVVGHSLAREKQAVFSTAIFTPDKDYVVKAAAWTAPLDALAATYKTTAGRKYKEICAALKIKPEPPKLTPDELAWGKVIPVRSPNFVCPLQPDYLVEKLGDAIMERVKLRGYAAYEAINFADGRRSVLAITQAVAAEYGPQNIQDVADFFSILSEAGLFSLKR
jgi:hypothetical protein